MRLVRCEICQVTMSERENYDEDGYPKIPHLHCEIEDRLPVEIRDDLKGFDGYGEWDICISCFAKVLTYAKQLKGEASNEDNLHCISLYNPNVLLHPLNYLQKHHINNKFDF